MKLRIYKFYEDVQDLTDNEKVFLWFTTMIFREVGWQETITLDAFDYKKMLFGSKRGDIASVASFPQNIKKFFDINVVARERVVLSLSDYVFEWMSRKAGPKDGIGVIPVEVEDISCQKVAIYLSACLNNMETLIVPEEEGGKLGLLIDRKSRFRRAGEGGEDYLQHDRFSFDQMFDE